MARGRGIRTFGSLFLPAHIVPRGTPGPDADTLLLPTGGVLGAQALLLATPFARYAAEHWPVNGGPTSARLAALAEAYAPGGRIPYRRPSLIEHASPASSWAGIVYRAEVWEEG